LKEKILIERGEIMNSKIYPLNKCELSQEAIFLESIIWKNV